MPDCDYVLSDDDCGILDTASAEWIWPSDCGRKGMNSNMGNDYKYEAKKQYLRYFRVWFVIAGILAVICIGLTIAEYIENQRERTNGNAPEERVYDYADVLTTTQEEELRQMIAKAERKHKIDIVLVTVNQPMEGEEAKQAYGYSTTDWVQNMRDVADDFWDDNKYGFNKDFEGDGALLLSNWYEGQGGEHLTTSGSVEYAFSSVEIDYLLNQVGICIETNPYEAYRVYVDTLCDIVSDREYYGELESTKWVSVLTLPTIIAVIYLFVHMYRKKDRDTTTANTYVAGGKPVMNQASDQFLRKHVTKRRIETNSSSGGGSRSSGRSSGGGGHHRSSSGASHGGGSRRR